MRGTRTCSGKRVGGRRRRNRNAEALFGIGNLMPHLKGVVRWEGRALVPEGAGGEGGYVT